MARALPPRRLRMRRSGRLQAAPKFIQGFTGKRLVLGYATWFGVDRTCAIKELRLLGVEVSAMEEAAARRALAAAHLLRERRLARQAAAAAIALDLEDDALDELDWEL